MRNKLYYACMAVVLCVAGLVTFGCSRNDNNNPKEPAQVQKYHMVVNVSKGTDTPSNGQRRVLEFDGSTIKATWAKGEEVTVYNETKQTAIGGVLTAQSNGASTTLEGDLTGSIEPSDVLTLKFLCPDYAEQKGTLEYISANCDYAEASVTVASVSNGNITPTANAVFENKQAIVRFTLIDQADGTTLLKPTSLTINDGTADIATLTDIPTSAYTTNGDGVLYVALPGFTDKTVTLTARLGAYIYTYEKEHATFTNGQYYSITVKMDNNLLQGALPGEFSVSATKKVRFSKGNLQFNAVQGSHRRVDGTTAQGTWRFAEHQYDYIGQSNDNRSATYPEWIDLFCWGTSGYNNKYPYMTSYYYADYGDGYNDIENTYYDWGLYNEISNDGGYMGKWYTLSKSEWEYLFNNRANAKQLFCVATIDTIKGCLLFPDGWNSTDYSFVMNNNNFADNTLSFEEWSNLENLNVVFLPATGRCVDGAVYSSQSTTTHYGIRDEAAYWSTTHYSSHSAYGLAVPRDDWSTLVGNIGWRYYATPVRLVIDKNDVK